MKKMHLKTYLHIAAIGFGLVGCQGNDTSLIGPNAQEADLAQRAGKAVVAQKPAAVLLQVTQADGTPAPNLTVSFSRMISGQTSEPSGNATTDANGRASLTIQTDRSTGYYSARAVQASGQTVGQWHSIPINSDGDNIFTLPIGGKMQVHPAGPNITVMTRNIYLGGDINRVLVPSDPTIPIPVLVAQTWGVVQQTNFAERAKSLADEIAVSHPELIGLQEVTLYRIQSPGDFLTGNPVKASTVALDQLAVLLNELNARGLNYEAVAIAEGIDIELPMATGQTTPLADIRLTDREVILARKGLKIDNVIQKKFNATVPVSLGGLSFNIPRAYASVEATLAGRTIRFMTTHLEMGSAEPIQRLQAKELLQTIAANTLPTILVGDFNSDANGTTTQTYKDLIGAGLTDIWNIVNPNDPGFTGSQQENLRNSPSTLNRRIDLIFTRSADNLAVLNATVVGDEERDRTPSGLWPSDHAGVIAAMRLPAIKPF